MSTLTALEPRPLIFSRTIVEIELVLATPEDLKELHKYGSDGEKIYKLRTGMIYWLRSSLKNKIEPSPRILKVDDDHIQIKEWLDSGMIYVPKCDFR